MGQQKQVQATPRSTERTLSEAKRQGCQLRSQRQCLRLDCSANFHQTTHKIPIGETGWTFMSPEGCIDVTLAASYVKAGCYILTHV